MHLLIVSLLLLTGVRFAQDQGQPAASQQGQPAQTQQQGQPAEGQQPPAQNQQQPATPTPTGPATKVGNETCLTCHDIAAVFSHNPHAKQECEACHGPGSVHADSGGDDKSVSFKAHPPSWANHQCLQCHWKEKDVSDFHKAAHGRNGLSCISCHQIHGEGVRFSLLQSEETTLCISCHQKAAADFQKPFHHPVMERAVKCSDCHSPHEENLRPMMRLSAGSAQRCVACHSEKRGPFVFEHVAVRVNNCEYCHEPHGSVNARMLRRSQVHLLCLECHSMTPGVLTSQPPAFHDIRSPRYRECTVCHRQIHGSNANPAFLK